MFTASTCIFIGIVAIILKIITPGVTNDNNGSHRSNNMLL